MDKIYFNSTQAARYLEAKGHPISGSDLLDLIRKGKGPVYRECPGCILFKQDDLDRYVEGLDA